MDTVTVIRKKLRSSPNDTSFKQEKECLELLQLLHHANIVELYCSYTYLEEHNLLFPLLDMDLENFFKLETRFGEFRRDFTFFTALCGLSSALDYVHNYHFQEPDHSVDLTRIGYHRDIRPRNILVNSKTFLLTDFGLARMREVDNGSQSTSPNIISDYVAPECMDAGLNNQKVGRPVDIWAFGCLIIDIVSYMVQGPQGRNQAQQKRKGSGFYPNFTDSWFFAGDELKDGVTEWVQELRRIVEGETAQVLLDLSMEILQIQPSTRPKAEAVYRKASLLATKALFDAAKIGLNRFDTSSDEFSAGTWLEARLTRWGESLNLTETESQSFMSRLENHEERSERYFQRKLLNIIEISNKDSSPASATPPKSPINHLESHTQRARQLEKSIQELICPVSTVNQNDSDLRENKPARDYIRPLTVSSSATLASAQWSTTSPVLRPMPFESGRSTQTISTEPTPLSISTQVDPPSCTVLKNSNFAPLPESTDALFNRTTEVRM